MNFSFSKKEKLTSEKEIEQLFKSGSKFTLFPFRVQWNLNNKGCNQILISCPKKRIKSAVDRNYIKRRMREAYRLNKVQLLNITSQKQQFINVAFVYIGNETVKFDVISQKLSKAIEKLTQELSANE